MCVAILEKNLTFLNKYECVRWKHNKVKNQICLFRERFWREILIENNLNVKLKDFLFDKKIFDV